MFTSSMPEINPDQFMASRPAPSHHNNDNAGDSRFAKLVNDAERSTTRHEDKKETYSSKEDKHLSKPEPKKNDYNVKTEQSASRPEGRQETEDTTNDHEVSKDAHNKDESGTEAKATDVKTEKKPEVESTNSELEDNDINGDVVSDTDITENDTEGESAPVEEQVIASFEQAFSNEIDIPNQGSEEIAGTINNTEEGDLSNSNINNAKYASNSGGTSPKENIQIIEPNSGNIAATVKQQGNTANDKGQITNENKDAAIEQSLDEITSGELNSEEGQDEGSGSDNKGFNKNAGFGKGEFDELNEEVDLDEELKEKIKVASTRELPDKYAKKIETDQSDRKTVQSQLNPVDPETLEELNNFKTLQDGMLFNNSQNQANNIGTNTALKGVADTTLNSLESINSNTTVTNAEMMQNQAMTMAGGKAGAGLMNSNAARASAFSEVLNQVVYVAKGKNKLGVTINHEKLGKLKIDVSMNKGILNIHVNASDKVVREYLESNVQSIIESLSKDGVSVGSFSVALKDHNDNQEKKFLMDSGISREYENNPVAAVHSNRGLVNVFA